jgi:hypothetical protein
MKHDNFLEELRFFSPSQELTKSLFKAIDVTHFHDQVRASEDRDQAEDVGDDYLRNLPKEEIAEANVVASVASERASEQEETFLRQRFIAEELYYHLAFLARSPQAKSGKSLPIGEAVAHDMGNVLGLSQQESLLGKLADEFTVWLSEAGQHTTGWGNIILAEGNRLYLEEFQPGKGDAAVPKKRVFVPHSSRKQERAARKLEARRASKVG